LLILFKDIQEWWRLSCSLFLSSNKSWIKYVKSYGYVLLVWGAAIFFIVTRVGVDFRVGKNKDPENLQASTAEAYGAFGANNNDVMY